MPFVDPETKRRYDAERYAANREAVKLRIDANRRADPEGHRRRTRAWYAAHPLALHARRFVSHSNRRALRWSVSPARLRIRDVMAVTGPCAYCGCALPDGGWDHVVPLCHGGVNAIENLVPCCLLDNRRKGRRKVSAAEAETILRRARRSPRAAR